MNEYRRKDKNTTDEDDGRSYRFYGPATGCDELGKLGYTLNGYYLVNGKRPNKTLNNISMNQLEVVECSFHQRLREGKQYK